MANIDFTQFDKNVDLNQYKEGLNKASENDIQEVPAGNYIVSVEKLELGVSKSNKPMAIVWFNILEGEYANQKIFWYKLIDNPVGGSVFRQFLRTLDSGLTIEFESFSQFANLVLDVHEAINGKLEYSINYTKNAKGFADIKVKEVFDAE